MKFSMFTKQIKVVNPRFLALLFQKYIVMLIFVSFSKFPPVVDNKSSNYLACCWSSTTAAKNNAFSVPDNRCIVYDVVLTRFFKPIAITALLVRTYRHRDRSGVRL
jgi:hypothetical protein